MVHSLDDRMNLFKTTSLYEASTPTSKQQLFWIVYIAASIKPQGRHYTYKQFFHQDNKAICKWLFLYPKAVVNIWGKIQRAKKSSGYHYCSRNIQTDIANQAVRWFQSKLVLLKNYEIRQQLLQPQVLFKFHHKEYTFSLMSLTQNISCLIWLYIQIHISN